MQFSTLFEATYSVENNYKAIFYSEIIQFAEIIERMILINFTLTLINVSFAVMVIIHTY